MGAWMISPPSFSEEVISSAHPMFTSNVISSNSWCMTTRLTQICRIFSRKYLENNSCTAVCVVSRSVCFKNTLAIALRADFSRGSRCTCHCMWGNLWQMQQWIVLILGNQDEFVRSISSSTLLFFSFSKLLLLMFWRRKKPFGANLCCDRIQSRWKVVQFARELDQVSESVLTVSPCEPLCSSGEAPPRLRKRKKCWPSFSN